jgi:hypothetical protein
MRAQFAADAASRKIMTDKVKDTGWRLKPFSRHTCNVIGVVGLTTLAAAAVTEAIGYGVARKAGVDYQFGSTVKQLFTAAPVTE